jgi:16S rRNA processing protein RimM
MARVGRVARAHGNRGQLIVDPDTDFPEDRFKPDSIVFVRNGDAVEPRRIVASRFHRGRPILTLEGVDTMNAAETLAGAELRVDVEALQPLPAGAFYQHDLIGCAVETAEGIRIGIVTGVEGGASGSRLVVQGSRGDEILIPLAEEIVAVHLAGRRIVVNAMEGLLDLNSPRRQRF